MRFDELNESNYMLFAIKFYDNPQSVTKDDFESDLKRIRYVKRLLKRYKNTGELKVHLILNHLNAFFRLTLFIQMKKILFTIRPKEQGTPRTGKAQFYWYPTVSPSL